MELEKVKQELYLELDFRIYPLEPFRDILVHELANQGFDAFVETDFGLTTYTLPQKFNEKQMLTLLYDLEQSDCQISYRKQEISVKNWNEEVEKSLAPVVINRQCVICKPEVQGLENYAYRILIAPNMTFGTGHHPTTQLMADNLFNYNLDQKTLYDVGCGTGILSILAEKRGAKEIHAIDIDPMAFENLQHNMQLNETHQIWPYLGTLPTTELSVKADMILANLSRNILLEEMELYFEQLNARGYLLCSGFLQSDMQRLVDYAQQVGFKKIGSETKEGWGFLAFYKI